MWQGCGDDLVICVVTLERFRNLVSEGVRVMYDTSDHNPIHFPVWMVAPLRDQNIHLEPLASLLGVVLLELGSGSVKLRRQVSICNFP